MSGNLSDRQYPVNQSRTSAGEALSRLIVLVFRLDGALTAVGDVQTFDWGWFVFFADPDGNRWAVQQIPPRS